MAKTISIFMSCFLSMSCHAVEPWSAIGKYYGGMSKSQAQKVGLSNCKQFDSFSVICQPSTQVELGGAPSFDSKITLDAKTGLVKEVSFKFDLSSEEKILQSMVKMYGEGTVSMSGCGRRTWDRDDDNIIWLSVCNSESRHVNSSGYGVFVRSEYMKGRGVKNKKQAAIVKREFEKREQRAKSFESK